MKLSQQLIYTLLLCLGFQLNGQTPVTTLECGQADLRMSLRELRINDSLERRYQTELSAENRLLRFGFSEPESSNPPPYVIPIVVHVIHDNGPENISTARVLQGVEWLNQSFANSDYYDQGTGVNTQIQFCLAQRTPDNQPTNGITYTQSSLTNITSINDDLPMKNLARWDPTQYINIYIVREICTSSCGVAGYAYYPSAHGLPMDGIVMEARWLGLNEANNSVLTHEMGHSLGLAHTFDNGCPNNDCLVDGDRVCDTPPDQSTVAVPCGGTANSCSTDTDSGFATDQNDMFNNYMDYGNFGCYNALTQGQTDRMHFFIEGIRASLLTSPGCQTPCPAVVTAGFDQSPLGTSFEVGTTLNFTNTSVNGNGFEWYVNGVLQSSSVDFNLLLDSPGSYQVKLVAEGTPPLCLADSTTIFIQAFCDLDAEYTAANNQPELGQEVLFSAPVAGYNSYEWTVNGAVESSTDQLLFLFDQVGIYEICLTVEEGNCSQEHCSFYFISNPPITDSCFGPTGVSVYALNAGEIVTAGPLILNGNGGFWQVLRVDNEIVFQEMDGVGNILRIGSANILDSNFNRFSDFTLLSDGTLLLAYFNGFNIDDRYSYFLRYDPDNDAIVYRKEINYPGTLYNLVPIPGINSSDQFLALFDINSESTSNGSNEAWLFDLDGITGDFETNWNYQTTQGGPHTISHGYFNQAGDFQGIGRIGVTALTSSFRAGIARFSTPNNLSSLRLLHRPATTSARLYGSQLIPLEPRVFSVHNGNPTGTSTTTNYWAYLSLWNNDFLNFTVEYRTAGSQRTIIEGTALEGDTLYHLVRSISQQEDFRFVMATDFLGEILWAYRYELPIGELGATSSSVDCRIYATNNSLIIPFTVRGSGAGGTLNDQAAALLRLNLDGTLDDGCVTITPVEVSFTEVDAINFPFQMDSGERAKIAFDQENPMTDLIYPQYNGCADSCSTSTGDCGLTGEQFAQVWDFGDNISAQGQAIIADGFGGLVSMGSSETEIFINRLDIFGNPVATYTIDIPTGPGNAEVIAVDVTSTGKLLMGGIIPPRPGMNRTGFITCFDLISNSLDWWRELDDDAEVMGVHILPDTDDFILAGARLWQNSSGNSSVLFQRRSIVNGQLTGTLYEEYEYGPHADQILSSELIGGTLYTATRYSISSGNAGMRAGVSWYNVNSGAEILSMIAAPGPSLDSRTYNNSIAIRQNEIYALYRGDLNGTGTTDVSKVYLAKFTTSGQWVWGREYDLLNFPGEYGMSLEILDNHLIISGNGYGPRDLFALRVNQANGDVIWAKGYHDGNGNDLAFNLRGDQSMLVTNTAFFFTAYSQSAVGLQRPIVIKTNTAGVAPTDNCLETYDLSLEINDLDPWNESSLEPWQEPLLDEIFSPEEGTVDIINLTFCLDSCSQPVPEEICDNGIDDDGNGFTDCEDPALEFDCCCLEGPAVMLPPDTIICPGEQFVLHPLGSTVGLIIDWSTGENGDTIFISDPGIYSITVTDTCGYLAIDSILIDTLELPGPIDLGPDLEVCDNGVLSLNAGPGYSSYLWSDFTTEQTATFYDPGTYSVTVTDECGNAYSDTVSLATLPATILDLPEIISLCPQDSQLVAASGFVTYAWFPLGATSCDNCPEITVYPPSVGDTLIYTLVVSNDAGCFSTDSLMVTTASLAGTSTSASICTGEVYDFNGTLLTDAGTYTHPSFCGGTDTLELELLLPPPLVELVDTICIGDSVFVFGEWQFEAAVLLDTMMAENGCDSVRRFTLLTETAPVTMSSERICVGDSILIFGAFRSQAGEYTMTFAQADDLCDSMVIVTLDVEPKPTVTIQVSDDECGLATAAVDLLGVPAGTTVDWQEPGLFGTTLELESGLYPFTLTSATGCTLDSFLVVDIPTSVELEISGFSPLCPDGQDGYLLLSPRGTRSSVSINGAAGLQLDSLGGLSAGSYAVSITDTLGCTSEWDIVIDAPTGFQLLLPEDTIIRLGEALQINGRLFSIEESLVDLQWSPLDYLSCDTCLITTSLPTESITYQLLAIDPLGCSRLDSIRISVDKQSRIYVPSAFSPNGDGVNDVFFPNFGPEIEAVEIMQIYERWGGLVYEREDFPPNDPAYGWDGSIGGKTMDPNVFVWHIRVRLLDGQVLDFSGDLTLIR